MTIADIVNNDVYYVCRKNLTPNVKISVMYAQHPFFSGDVVRVLVTFHHVNEDAGEEASNDAGDEAEADTDTGGNDNGSGDGSGGGGGDGDAEDTWGRRMSMQLSRSLFLSQLAADNDDNSDETFLSGSLQLFGHFRCNRDLMSTTQFAKLREQSVIGGSIAGVPSYKVSQATQRSFLQNLTSFLNSDISDFSSTLNHTINSEPNFDVYPIFSTRQFLMFSSISVHPGQFKQYYFQFKLPEHLPSSYRSEHIEISYNLIVNMEKLIDGQVVNKSISLPLKIYVKPQCNGQQPVANLCTQFLINKQYINTKFGLNRLNKLVELRGAFVSSFAELDKAVLTETNSETETPIHEDEEFEEEQSADYKREFVQTMKTLVKENLTTTEQIKSLPNTPMMSNFVPQFAEDAATEPEGRASISELSEMLAKNHVMHGDELLSSEDARVAGFERVIKTALKTQFFVKFQQHNVAKMVFDKPFYKIGDTIALAFDFSDAQKYKVTGLTVSLEEHERFGYEFLEGYEATIAEIHEQFANDPVGAQRHWNFPRVNESLQGLSYYDINANETIYNKIRATNPQFWSQFTRTVWEKNYSMLSSTYKTFNVNDLHLAYDLVPQFATNVFSLRYTLHFKFILVDEADFLASAMQDENGELKGALENLTGLEFKVKVPLNVLPSEKSFNGVMR